MHPLGNEEEIEALTRSLFHYFLSKKSKSVDDAWDLVQETLVRVLQTLAKGEELKSAEGYSVGVAKKVVLEYYRKCNKASRHDCIDTVNTTQFKDRETPEDIAIQNNLVIRFHYGLDKLPEHMKDLLVERFIEEVPARSIANRLGKPHSSIDMRVYRAKHKLRKMVL